MSQDELRFSSGEASIETSLSGFFLGVVRATDCAVGPSPAELLEEIHGATSGFEETPEVRARFASVRDMLRFGVFRPTGRNKPASEYLVRAACSNQFPKINNLVDVINLISLRYQLPISLLDVALAGSTRFRLRHGKGAESYVFNNAGQMIDLQDLLLIAPLPNDIPCANPIKDSMATKLTADSSDVLAVIYAPSTLADVCRTASQDLTEAFEKYAGRAS